MMELGKVYTESVTVPERLRDVDPKDVESLAESMAAIGLQQPITVYAPNENEAELVAGAHRLEAARKLGWEKIDCVFADLTADERQLWEIDENLMRSELSQAEYSRHVALRKDVYERMYGEAAYEARPGRAGKCRQVGDNSDPADRFTADTAAKTGKSERSVQRAAHRGENIASDVMERIKGTRLDTGKYQDELAKLSPEQQRQKVEADLAQPPAAKRGTSAGQDEAEKADQRDRKKQAAGQIANLLAEHIPANHWAALKANLRTVSGKDVADAFERETGVAVFDNTEAA